MSMKMLKSACDVCQKTRLGQRDEVHDELELHGMRFLRRHFNSIDRQESLDKAGLWS